MPRLSKVTSWCTSIRESGITAEMSLEDAKHIRFSNTWSLGLWVFSFAFGLFFLMQGELAIVLVCFLFLLVTVMGIVLNSFHFYTLTRMGAVLVVNGIFMGAVVFLYKQGTVDYYGGFYLLLLAMEILILFPKQESALMHLSILITVFCFVTTVFLLNPLFQGEQFMQISLHQVLALGLFVIFLAFGYVFRDLWLSTEEKLRIEREKSEKLLLNILPAPIAQQLKHGQQTIADVFEDTTILFADIVGFTPLSARMPPHDLVVMLNTLFSAFDDLVEQHGVEKIKTIGDAYMVAAGLPQHRTDHAQAIAAFAVDMRRTMSAFNATAGHSLQLRIGIHSGSVIAGVIGKKKFSYDLWGDTVNTAARMESHGIPGEIQVSQATYELLKDTLKFEERGQITVKGKGSMRVYLLKELVMGTTH